MCDRQQTDNSYVALAELNMLTCCKNKAKTKESIHCTLPNLSILSGQIHYKSVAYNSVFWYDRIKEELTYAVCGCAVAANRLGPANENGSDASPNISKPKGSLPKNPPIMPKKSQIHALY